MAISAEQLNVILSARDREFTRAMDRAQRRVERFSQQSNRSLMSSGKAFTALAGAARTFLPALSAGLVIQQVRRVVSELDEIGKKADAIGLTTDALQELRVIAEEAGVSQEALDNSMMQFSRRLGEARQGLGQARYALDALNLSASDLGEMPLDQALQTVADEMMRVEDATSRTALAQQLFGRSGVPMLNLLREGAAGMEAMRQNARDLGIVIDENLIRSAEETENKLGLLSRVINSQLSEALINIAPLLVATANGIAAIARTINYLFTSMPIEDRMTERLQQIATEVPQIQSMINEASRTGMFPIDESGQFPYRNIEEATNALETLAAEQLGIEEALRAIGQDPELPPAIDPITLGDAADGAKDLRTEYEKMLATVLEGDNLLSSLGFTVDTLKSTFDMMESQMESAFMGMVEGTVSAKDAFRSMARDIVAQLYRVLVVQQLVGSVEAGTGLAGMIGGALGVTPTTGAASGRSVQAGQPYTVGEHGRELFVPQSAGRVLSVAQTKNAMGNSSSQPVVVNYNFQGGVTEADLGRALPLLVERTKREVVTAVQRGGSVAKVFR